MLNPVEIEHQRDYIQIHQILPLTSCQLIGQYARFKRNLRPKVGKKGDPLEAIHREYGDLLMETLLEQFSTVVSQALDLEVWPTLSFYYTYTHGNQLKKHKDRSSCEYVAGLFIDADEKHLEGDSWPLFLKTSEGEIGISLKRGDLIIFKGHETEHWRFPFQDEWFVSAIFGFVAKHGPYAFQKFDQRKALGKPHVGMFRWSLRALYASLRNKISSKSLIT